MPSQSPTPDNFTSRRFGLPTSRSFSRFATFHLPQRGPGRGNRYGFDPVAVTERHGHEDPSRGGPQAFAGVVLLSRDVPEPGRAGRRVRDDVGGDRRAD